MSAIYMMGIITNRGMRDKFIAFFKENNVHVTLAALSAGTADSAILDYLGMESSEKVVYLAFVTRDTWKQLKEKLYRKVKIDIPGRGIAFLIPLSSIGGKNTLQYLTVDQTIVLEEESTLKNTDYELLVAIANAGYTETIMDAARSADAPGGTVIHAKGTGMEHAKRFLGISLAEEKEIVLIVLPAAQKNNVMKAIMDKAGLKSPAGAIVFSLPVTSTAGLRMPENEE